MKNDVLEQLFNEYYNEAILYVYSLCHSVEVSEDIVVDAFYKAVSTLDDKIENFKYWLLRVCKNLYIDYYRKKRKVTYLDGDVSSDDESIIDKLIKEERHQALYRAISLLEDDYKEVIMLFYFENMKISEIALILNKSIDNIKVILYRSREKLRKLMEEKNEL